MFYYTYRRQAQNRFLIGVCHLNEQDFIRFRPNLYRETETQ